MCIRDSAYLVAECFFYQSKDCTAVLFFLFVFIILNTEAVSYTHLDVYKRQDLDGLAEVSALTLLVQHVPVDLAGGEVRILVQVLVDEALVMAQVQVGLGADVYKRQELRSPDPTCNPYLAIGLVLAAGLDGIENRMEL